MQTTDIDVATNDLGPLAWVLDELRKSLDTASAALRRYVRDTGQARGSDMVSVDDGQLRIARQQLHQAVGALEMVGLGAPASLLRAMEAAVQRFVEKPALCDEAASSKVERAGFALTEYLEGVLLGKPVSAVALFPQFRDVQELAGADRVHPADLWPLEWRWTDVQAPATEQPLSYDLTVRSRMDKAVLRVIKSGDPEAAREMATVCLGLASTQSARQPKIFWQIAAAYFEALSLELLPLDLYVKRAASRVLLQYASLAKGELGVSDRLAQDLVFFCSQAVPPRATDAPVLTAVRQAWGLARFKPVDYQTSQYGRFDPVLLAQARKRIGLAKETWSTLAGGEAGKLRNVGDQFNLVSDSLTKLHPSSGPLARSMNATIDSVVKSGQPPTAQVAMEVATAVLYLEAAFEDLDPTDTELTTRTARLAQRLDSVWGGSPAEPLESWMEELYRRVSDRQTMGSVVGELRTTLSELEKVLDIFFRNPADKAPLQGAPGHLSQMRGVLSVLGLDQAAQAVLRMREAVEAIIVTEIDEERVRTAGTFEKLGNNLGALGFLIDMLSYQPTLAKKLFVYDDSIGELKPLMGRAVQTAQDAVASVSLGEDVLSRQVMSVVSDAQTTADTGTAQQELSAKLDTLATQAILAEQPAIAQKAREASAAVSSHDAHNTTMALHTLAAAVHAPPASTPARVAADVDIEEDDLQDIFLQEAREVVVNGLAAIDTLQANPADLSELTTLRRAFHTLKGSSRMVGLTEFGEAGWSMEQLLNTWLADQKPASGDMLSLTRSALQGFARWIEDIAAHSDGGWEAAMFRGPAEAMRNEQRLVPLMLPGAVQDMDFSFDMPTAEAPSESAASTVESIDVVELPDDFNFDIKAPAEDHEVSSSVAQPSMDTPVEIEGIDFGSLAAVAGPASEPDAPLAHAPMGSLEDFDVPELEAEQELDDGHESLDEQVKVIGTLRIGIPLYNVYLHEADEWSRRLLQELSEWALELEHPVPESAEGLAHALAGSSATVGFNALSDVARALEASLKHAGMLVGGTPQHGKVFIDAAEEIRRLLHQFAAGFLKEADPGIVPALAALEDVEAPRRSDVASAYGDLDSVLPPASAPAPLQAQANFAPTSIPTQAPPPMRSVSADLLPAHRYAAEEEIDLVDALDEDLFPVFEDEAAELMPQLGGALRQWSARPDNGSARDEVLRALHTLKGSARLAGAMRMGEMAHRMESEIDYLGSQSVLAANIEPLLQRFDNLQANFDGLRAKEFQPAEGAAETPLVDEHADVADVATEQPPKAAADAAAPRTALALPAATLLAPQRAAANQAVRVRSQLLDRLVNQAGEVMITRSRLEAELGQLRSSLGDLTGNLDRLRSQLRDIELQAESQMQSRLAQAKDSAQNFDPLEFDRFTRVQELTRMMAESVNDVATVQRNLQRTVEATEDDLIAQARQTRELQRDLLRTRMVEFEGISERLYRVVRLASKETGKQVKLDITGGSIEMDRGVLERMTPAFEHLLRNCVAHGVELPGARTAAGKDATGTILIGLHHEGNDVSVEFRDDGAGLDLPRIREKAMQQGLIAPGQELSDAQASNLIFMPGFSTATQVTELSGRGIGMDVVRAEVNALGGRIEISTEAGKGSNFKLVLPLTTAVTQVVMIRSGNLSVGVPANVVELVRRATAKEVEQAYNSGTFDFNGEQLPFYWSGALLQSSQRSTQPQAKTLPVVIFRSAAQRIALHVDEVLGNQEVVVKNLGPQLSRLPGLAGMTVLASGAVVLIYNPVALTAVYGEQARLLSADHAQAHMLDASGAHVPAVVMTAAPTIPLVLVVDDSITVRRVTQRLLQREGYRVALAADGLQALEKLADERPAVVLSDIEMPRMDGFDLARNIRGDARLGQLPIIMITSRIAEKHREHAMELGVNHYLGKPYSEEELLSLVKHYASAAELTA